MSDLTSAEKRKIEKLLGMQTGYVLDFSNRSFAEFMDEHAGVSVYAPGYDAGGTSKACRLRTFWAREPNHVVGRVLAAMVEYARENKLIRPDEAELAEECRRIAARLLQASAVDDLSALHARDAEPDFEVVAREVQDAINNNRPEAGLDRLHTYVVKFVRSLASARGIGVDRDKPLHSVFGEYVKALRAAGHIESQMTDRMLKASIGTLEAFNDVRNEQSLAHDNPILNFDESLLIFRHVASTIRFLRALEERLKKTAPPAAPPDDDIPF